MNNTSTKIAIIDVLENRIMLNGEIKESLSYFDLDNHAVILGASTDPFFPFETQFSTGLAILKILKDANLRSLEVRTCTPLLLVAVPLFKSLDYDLEVKLRVSTNSRQKHLPKAAEVLQAAKVLMQHKITTRCIAEVDYEKFAIASEEEELALAL